MVGVLEKKMSEIESKVERALAMVPHLLDAPPNLHRKARTLFQGMYLDVGTQVEDVRRKEGILAEIVPDILPHLEGVVD